MKKLSKGVAALGLAATLAGCTVGGGIVTSSKKTDSSQTERTDYMIGVIQLVTHPALDAATNGFVDTLKADLNLTDDNFDIQNAAGEAATCSSIATALVQENCDLILANATASLQAAASATSTIPVLGTAVTEYGTALDIADFDGTVGTNVSGTADLAPLDQQAAMFDELLPDAKKIGILYCSGEPNSVYQAKVVKEALEKNGKTVETYTFADTNDVAQVTKTACDESDALYIPTDNTAASCTEAIDSVASQAGTPIIAGEEGIMSGCGIATLSIDYYQLGVTTAKMAEKILSGEKKVSEMPIEYYDNPVKEYDADRCEKLGIKVPSDYTAYSAD